MKQTLVFLSILGWMGSTVVFGAGRGDEVFVVYNSRVPESKGVAEHYASVRQVPANQVLGLDLPENETMQRRDFTERLQNLSPKRSNPGA
jgi:hypothetical protein